MTEGTIVKVSGPLVVASGMREANMFDVVRVGEMRLIGEIIEIRGDRASIQVYEETAGIGPGDRVYSTGEPLSVELGPGLISSIYDGIQRPLDKIAAQAGTNLPRGIDVSPLDRERLWQFTAAVQAGAAVTAGDIVGTVKENDVVDHKIMVPPTMNGEYKVKKISDGEYKVDDIVCVLEDAAGAQVTMTLAQKWPVRRARPIKEKLAAAEPMITGSRTIDSMFPIAKGGTACIPGPFGSGKTVVQHQLAKWSDVDIVVYIGCGERGNEMTDVLMEFPELTDPRNGEPLMKRTVLIANTSDMPVAAREASIYTGITIAEYFRDMGYDVAVLADSTSRWAEALREMSGRLEEMPGEEGYPAYLASRLAQFYERAGVVDCLGADNRRGSVTAIGAVSPPGGDTSEPVSQATMRIVKVFWGLDSSLAYARHFPAINWLTSYSLYVDNFRAWYNEQFGDRFMANRDRAMHVLQEEAELQEIVRLVGQDALSPADRLTMETAKMIREDFLQQNAFIDEDAYSSYYKQFRLLDMVLQYDDVCRAVLPGGADVNALFNIPARERIGRAKMVPQDEVEKTYDEIIDEMKKEVAEIAERGEDE